MRVINVLAIASLSVSSLGCAPAETKADANTTQAQPPAGHPPVGGDLARHGIVLEAIDAGSYTYVRVEADGVETWLAGPKLAVEVGQKVLYSEGMPMRDWRSDSLDRTWDEVLFVAELRVAGSAASAAAMPAGHPPTSTSEDAVAEAIDRAEGGLTVAEVHARRSDLAGEEVALRGKVVKANIGILGRNWFHVRDGSGSAESGDNDLTVTSSDEVQVGQLVSILGTVAVDRDFGAGYRYDVLLEDAQLRVE